MGKHSIYSWIDARRGSEHPTIRIPPEENVLIGSKIIMDYLGIQSINTLYQWIDVYGLPCVKRPDDGRWMTTMTAIDQWIILACEIDNTRRIKSRGTNHRSSAAQFRQERLIAEAETRKNDAQS